MESCGRFIEYIHRLGCRSFGKFWRKFDTLGFSTGKCRSWLSYLDVSKSDLIEHIKNLMYPRMCWKEILSFFDIHVQNLGYILSFVSDFQSLLIVAASMTVFTFHINIRQEMHLNLLDSASFTDLTSSSFRIERESSWSISPFHRFLAFWENISYMGKYSSISRNIGMRSPSNRRLVYDYDLVQIMCSFYRINLSDRMNSTIKGVLEIIRQDVQYERWFTWTWNSSHHSEKPKRDLHIHVLKIVLFRSDYL